MGECAGFGAAASLEAADVDVALKLVVDDGAQCPEIEMDLGLDVLGIDFPSEDGLAANADCDAGLAEVF
jgi:hypothetical protein